MKICQRNVNSFICTAWFIKKFLFFCALGCGMFGKLKRRFYHHPHFKSYYFCALKILFYIGIKIRNDLKPPISACMFHFVKQPMPISVDTNSNQKCDLRIRDGLMYKMNVRMYVTFYEQLFTENCNRRRRHVNVNSKNGYEEIIFWFFFFSSFARLEIVNVNTMNAIAFWKLEYVSILVSSFGIGQPNIFFFLSWIHLGTIPMTRSSSNIQPPC